MENSRLVATIARLLGRADDESQALLAVLVSVDSTPTALKVAMDCADVLAAEERKATAGLPAFLRL